MKSQLLHIETAQEEDSVAALMMMAVSECLRKTQTHPKYINELKLQKIVYKTCDDLNIPLTRSWYKRGCYVHNSKIKKENLINTPNFNSTPSEELLQLKTTYKKEYGIILKQLTNNINDIKYIAWEKLLDRIYHSHAPRQYRKLYLSNNKILETNNQLKGLLKNKRSSLLSWVNSRNMYSHYEIVSDSISEVHIELASNPEFQEIIDTYIDFTDVLEPIYIKAGELLSPETSPSVEMSSLFDSIEQFYYEYVWGCPALVMSKKTVKGARAEEYIEKSAGLINECEDIIHSFLISLDTKIESLELNPTLEKLEYVDAILSKNTASPQQDTFSEIWKLYNKV